MLQTCIGVWLVCRHKFMVVMPIRYVALGIFFIVLFPKYPLEERNLYCTHRSCKLHSLHYCCANGKNIVRTQPVGNKKDISLHALDFLSLTFHQSMILFDVCVHKCLTESSSADEVLRAKLITEFILSSFEELSEEADIISKGMFIITNDM